MERIITLLYDAISMLIDETFDEYDDNYAWLKMIFEELGTTDAELKSLGILITVNGELSSVEIEE